MFSLACCAHDDGGGALISASGTTLGHYTVLSRWDNGGTPMQSIRAYVNCGLFIGYMYGRTRGHGYTVKLYPYVKQS